MKCNQSGPGFELVSPCPYPSTLTITPRAPPNYSYNDSLQNRKAMVHSLDSYNDFFNIVIGIWQRDILALFMLMVCQVFQISMRSNEIKWFHIKKRQDAEDMPHKLWQTLSTQTLTDTVYADSDRHCLRRHCLLSSSKCTYRSRIPAA